jgi:hypothetical protein
VFVFLAGNTRKKPETILNFQLFWETFLIFPGGFLWQLGKIHLIIFEELATAGRQNMQNIKIMLFTYFRIILPCSALKEGASVEAA